MFDNIRYKVASLIAPKTAAPVILSKPGKEVYQDICKLLSIPRNIKNYSAMTLAEAIVHGSPAYVTQDGSILDKKEILAEKYNIFVTSDFYEGQEYMLTGRKVSPSEYYNSDK